MTTTTTTPMTATEMAKMFRGRLKARGIQARCSVLPGTKNAIRVSVPRYDAQFTEEEQREIRLIAKVNGMTRVRGQEIDIDRMTDPMQMNFYIY